MRTILHLLLPVFCLKIDRFLKVSKFRKLRGVLSSENSRIIDKCGPLKINVFSTITPCTVRREYGIIVKIGFVCPALCSNTISTRIHF